MTHGMSPLQPQSDLPLYAYEVVCITSSLLLVTVGARRDAPLCLILAGLASLHYRLPRCLDGSPGEEHHGPSYWIDVVFAIVTFFAVLWWKEARPFRTAAVCSALLMVAGIVVNALLKHEESLKRSRLLPHLLQATGHLVSSVCCLLLLL